MLHKRMMTTELLLRKPVDADIESMYIMLEKMKLVSKNPFHYIKRLNGIPLYSLRTGKYRAIMSIVKVCYK